MKKNLLILVAMLLSMVVGVTSCNSSNEGKEEEGAVCFFCGGTGKQVGEVCDYCGGSGEIVVKEGVCKRGCGCKVFVGPKNSTRCNSCRNEFHCKGTKSDHEK